MKGISEGRKEETVHFSMPKGHMKPTASQSDVTRWEITQKVSEGCKLVFHVAKLLSVTSCKIAMWTN